MNKELEVVAVPVAESFAAALGIGTKREEQLCDLIGQCYERTETYPQAIAGISQQVKDINELVYSVFHLGAFAGNEQARQELISLLEE